MTYTVEINIPSRAEGEDVEVMYLGVFPNKGGPQEVSEESVQLWEQGYDRKWPEGGNLVLPVVIPEATDKGNLVADNPESDPEVPGFEGSNEVKGSQDQPVGSATKEPAGADQKKKGGDK